MINDNHHIPFLDLITPHSELEEELTAVFKKALRSGGFIGGPMVQDFEEDFAAFCGSKFCVGVGSGTDALRFALIAAGVKGNQEVITVPNTFIATTEAITQAGAVPRFVDIDERTYNMDPEKLREFLETRCDMDSRTGWPLHRESKRFITAIIPVHLYGQPADMVPILKIAECYNLTMIEDACQAHGAEYDSKGAGAWRKTGSLGKAAAFSFYPGKNLGACGEAGAVTTDDEEMAQRIRMLRDHGQSQKYLHEMEGFNGRLDAIQAGILRIKLKHLSKWNEQRRQAASFYTEALAPWDQVITPHEPAWAKAVYHVYGIRFQRRDELQAFLMKSKIETQLHYPCPLHLQKAYEWLGYKEGDFPFAEKVSKEILSLPMHPHLRQDQKRKIAETMIAFLKDSEP